MIATKVVVFHDTDVSYSIIKKHSGMLSESGLNPLCQTQGIKHFGILLGIN